MALARISFAVIASKRRIIMRIRKSHSYEMALARIPFAEFIYKGNTSTHAQGTDPRVAVRA